MIFQIAFDQFVVLITVLSIHIEIFIWLLFNNKKKIKCMLYALIFLCEFLVLIQLTIILLLYVVAVVI